MNLDHHPYNLCRSKVLPLTLLIACLACTEILRNYFLRGSSQPLEVALNNDYLCTGCNFYRPCVNFVCLGKSGGLVVVALLFAR